MKFAIDVFKYANIGAFCLWTITCLRQWRSRGDASIRWGIAAWSLAATAMMSATLLTGVGRVPKTPAIVLMIQAMFFASSALFLVGLAPPRWLLRLWRRPEESAMQAAMGALSRAESPSEVAAVLLPSATGHDARVELFDEQARLASAARLETERELRHGIANRELVLHYQPVMRLADGVAIGVEALVRWNHPRLGLLLPGAFISVAEESELIVDIGAFALEEACRQTRAWRQTLPLLDEFAVWVNVSGAQFGRTDVPRAVAHALAASGLEPHSLGLEITESVFVDQTEALCLALTKIRSTGVRIAIDDFGTGFSSLGRLKDLPADVLKIDGSFVTGLGHAPEDSAIVAACVALGDALGLTAVAECIETADQFAALVAENCQFGQGYYFSAALPADEAAQYLYQFSSGGKARSNGDRDRSSRSALVAVVCDDEPSARMLYKSALESVGAEVEAVADGAACVEWAAEHRPDLALVDLRMPGHDGIWTITELRRRCPETRLVLMSADPDLGRFWMGLDSGADECMSKADVIPRLDDLVPAA